MTPAGDFATPVQTAYLCRDGLPVGRLPEFSFRGSVFDLLGGGFLGRTDGGPLGGDGWTLLEGKMCIRDSTKALLMTRGLAEVARLGMALGAHRETFAGLAGVGDLIVTCTSMHLSLIHI